MTKWNREGEREQSCRDGKTVLMRIAGALLVVWLKLISERQEEYLLKKI